METMNWGTGLPPDIGMSIFSRLVISNLAICRLVCKTWNALILDYASSSKLKNDFILSISDEVPNREFNRLCNAKMYYFRFDPTKHLDEDFDVWELEGNKSASSLPSGGDWSRVILLCSCNGLLFICKSNLYTMCHGIFNPMTNEFFHVPEVFDDIYAFGLGFIPTTKQYKLFRCTRSDLIDFNTQQEPRTIIDVFHFGRSEINPKQNQWRQLHSLPYIIEDGGIYINGVLYWLGKEKNKPNEYAIYALDVETEKIELRAILEVDPGSYNSNIEQFNGNIYAIIYIKSPTTSNQSFQVWRMQGKDTWIREFVIDDMQEVCGIKLIKVYENGEILCRVSRHSFCLYNPFTRRKKIIIRKTQNKYLTSFCQIESLNFGSLPNILAGGDESRMMRRRTRTRSKLIRRRSKRRPTRSILMSKLIRRRSKRRPTRSILMKSRSRLLRNILMRRL